MRESLDIRLAAGDDFGTIIGLVDDAAAWLQQKATDQWAKPWPNRAARDERILRGLRERRTWMVMDTSTPVATVTCKRVPNEDLWEQPLSAEQAVYVSRLIVSRDYAGWGIGASLIDWAGQYAAQEWGAQWIRIDVWTTNKALHEFYEKLGFTPCGTAVSAQKRGYPSAALFQKPTARIDAESAARFSNPRARRPGAAAGRSRQS